ncbi:GNAT family N-acetyltransferase [Saccharothrix obliqua]|uniref:GNAT family N-acetyltransferase n=1 Tax=Saccharothrix obliqua TaxID=2861747 RepID=UPI001C5E641B|nr:GNAT family N-acetyltransferase [Saccharothrix obliqua]MBW4721340.1 GNAT family N-acetyltransferase [Saccharothrix obliqua]
MTAGVEVGRFDPAHATEEDLRGYHEVMVARQEADRPDEPRLSYENVVGRLKNPFVGFGPVAHWVARSRGEVVGLAIVYFLEEESGHIGLTEVVVHPRVRRRGVGTAILKAVVPELRARGRSLVETWEITKGGEGERWAESLGFRTVHTVVLQALMIPEVDRNRWRVDVPAGYRLRRWVGAAPEDLVASFAAARNAMHDAPLGELGYQEPTWSVARVRAREEELRRNDIELRAVVAVHEGTGEVVGLTELEVHPHRPSRGYQRDTAVVPAHRGRGLGRCVKGHLTTWLLADRPGLDRIYTTTGAGNEHMIRVNHQLGYTTVRTMVAVNRDLAELEADLGSLSGDAVGRAPKG